MWEVFKTKGSFAPMAIFDINITSYINHEVNHQSEHWASWSSNWG